MTFPSPVEFRRALGRRPFTPAWESTLLGFYGRPMTAEQAALFKDLSGGVEPRPGGWDEGFWNIGRGGGKDDSLCTVADYECTQVGHEVAAAPGQRLPFAIITPLRSQAQGTVRMVQGESRAPLLKKHVASTTQDSVEFKNGTAVQVWTCDAVAVVGDTTCGYAKNEWALWPGSESVTPGSVIDSNLRPTLRRPEGAPRKRIISLSSSYTKDGNAWECFRDHYGKADAPVIVFHGSTLDFNPNTDRAWLANERKRMGDLAYQMHFERHGWRDAVTQGWFGGVVDKCIDRGRESSEPESGRLYVAAIDAAFKGDKFALSVAHLEERSGRTVAVLDRVTSWHARPGESLPVGEVVAQAAWVINHYCALAYADQFSFVPLRELFAQQGVTLIEAPWTATSKPQMFGRVRAGMSDGSVRLCDNRDLINEFHSIQGRLLRSGGERLEARVGHDDLVHASVMALFFADDTFGSQRVLTERNAWADDINTQTWTGADIRIW